MRAAGAPWGRRKIQTCPFVYAHQGTRGRYLTKTFFKIKINTMYIYIYREVERERRKIVLGQSCPTCPVSEIKGQKQFKRCPSMPCSLWFCFSVCFVSGHTDVRVHAYPQERTNLSETRYHICFHREECKTHAPPLLASLVLSLLSLSPTLIVHALLMLYDSREPHTHPPLAHSTSFNHTSSLMHTDPPM